MKLLGSGGSGRLERSIASRSEKREFGWSFAGDRHTRGNLTKLLLYDHHDRWTESPDGEYSSDSSGSVQQNSSVSSAVLKECTLDAEVLCSFIDTAVYVTRLRLSKCELAGGAQGTPDVVAALQRNTSIETLELERFGCHLDVMFR